MQPDIQWFIAWADEWIRAGLRSGLGPGAVAPLQKNDHWPVKLKPSSLVLKQRVLGATEWFGCVWKCCVPLNPMVLLIIIPLKWLFHWEYTLFSDKPISENGMVHQFHFTFSSSTHGSFLPGCSMAPLGPQTVQEVYPKLVLEDLGNRGLFCARDA